MYHRNNLLPIVLLDMSSGTFELSPFNFLREIFEQERNFEIPFILTKFNNCVEDTYTQLS